MQTRPEPNTPDPESQGPSPPWHHDPDDFIAIPRWLYHNAPAIGLDDLDLRILTMLADVRRFRSKEERRERWVQRKYDEWAAACNCGRRTLIRRVKRMEKLGALEVRHKGNKPNEYRFGIPEAIAERLGLQCHINGTANEDSPVPSDTSCSANHMAQRSANHMAQQGLKTVLRKETRRARRNQRIETHHPDLSSSSTTNDNDGSPAGDRLQPMEEPNPEDAEAIADVIAESLTRMSGEQATENGASATPGGQDADASDVEG